MKLNVLIGMKHFTQMIMVMNLTIHTTAVPLQTAVPHLTKFLTKSYWVKISLKREEMRRKDRRNVIKQQDETTKERTGNLHIHKIGININIKQLSKEYSQLLVVLLRKIARK